MITLNSIYRKINALFIVCSFLILLFNVIRLSYKGNNLIEIIFSINVYAIFIFLVYSILALFYENTLTRILQILFVFYMGIIACMEAPINFYSIGLWSVCIFIGYSYGFLDNFIKLKLWIYTIVLLIIFSFSLYINRLYTFDSLSMILYFLIYFIIHSTILFTIFKEKIQIYEKKLQNRNIAMQLGERTSIILHDMKNVIQKIQGSLYFLKDLNLEYSQKLPYFNIISNSLKDINDIFHSTLLSSEEETKNYFDIISLIRGLIHLYKLISKTKIIDIQLNSFIASYFIYGFKADFFTLIDNAFKNSIEAESTKIEVDINKLDRLCIQIKDNGKGIKKCFNCKKQECLECSSIFSTKENGFGLGIKSIKNTINKYRGSLFIISSSLGTNITILL